MGEINRRPYESTITLTVNGDTHLFRLGEGCHEVSPSHTLAFALRERLGLTGTKISCDRGACGCCTVMMDGKAVLSCTLLTVECEEKVISTIEGLGDPITGSIDPIQQSFIDHTAFQCGFCTPGIIMSTKALLKENPSPTRGEVQEAL
ncbi:MAG: 2Fe-2S iron-sulfur cluster-binding protein, partial [Desulfitobacterium hafniense]|nr:2Fe-2S iron-sulfur cluster-binding protein [Desulfitobacterium hafniense]